MSRQYDLCGFGNAMVDVLLQVDEAALAATGLEKGSMQLVENDFQSGLLSRLSDGKEVLVPGGSVANSLAVFSQLGGKAAYASLLGQDRYGEIFSADFAKLGIAMINAPLAGESSATCVSLIGADAQRTMCTSLAVLKRFCTDHVSAEAISASRWIFIEGYQLANPRGPEAVRKMLKLAKASDCKVALTLSVTWLASTFRDTILEMLPQLDLVFANDDEAMALSGEKSADAAMKWLLARLPGAAVSAGVAGAWLGWQGQTAFSPAFRCEPVDTTGAGDVFAGAVLYGLSRDLPAEDVVRAACYLCTRVILRKGARLDGDVGALWREGLSARSA